MTTNTNMTIYNQYTNSKKQVIFKKHLIDNVFWDDTKQVKQNDGYDKDNKVEVYIPKNKNDLTKYVEEYKGTGWTIQNGDYIIKGNIPIDEVSGIKELSKYKVYTIKSFSNKDYGSKNMHHFEIKGD